MQELRKGFPFCKNKKRKNQKKYFRQLTFV